MTVCKNCTSGMWSPPLPLLPLREKTSPQRLLMVYVQIKSAYLISLQCTAGTFNECVSLKSFHCQRNYSLNPEKMWYIVDAVARKLLQEKTSCHFVLCRVKTEISKEERADFSYRYRRNKTAFISRNNLVSQPRRNKKNTYKNQLVYKNSPAFSWHRTRTKTAWTF